MSEKTNSLPTAEDNSALTVGVANPSAAPPHTHTESTLAPTSEYVRYLLLALPARYSFRSILEGIFGTDVTQSFSAARDKFLDRFVKQIPGETNSARKARREFAGGIAYDYALGLGSLFLTSSYTKLVKRDIQNIFCETVGLELGKPFEKVTFDDIKRSDNKIVRSTVQTFQRKTWERYGADALFFIRPILRWLKAPFIPPVGDLMIGVKAVQALSDTWKRKPTMFEDLITFANNKINPRNGLGQPITHGEVFDLYQHYAEAYNPQRMFTSVLAAGKGEGARWAANQPVFERIAELMNKTYAYKHQISLGTDGHTIIEANFALPKYIYLLGHDMIDPLQPKRTLLAIEVANAHGIPAVNDMFAKIKNGQTVEQIAKSYNITLPELVMTKPTARPMTPGTTPGVPVPVGRVQAGNVAHEAVTTQAPHLNA